MARTLRGDVALAASILGLGLFLVFEGNVLMKQWQAAVSHRQSSSFEHLLGIVAGASGTAIVAWWVLSLTIALLASYLQRRRPRAGAHPLSKFSPAFMLRLAVALMSLNLLGLGAAQASTAPPDPSWKSTTASTDPAVAKSGTPMSLAGAMQTSLPPETTTNGREPADPAWRPGPPIVDAGLLSRQFLRETRTPSEESVVVNAGDSLWSIASSRLGPLATDLDIAMAWPKWYIANRATIGADPTVLLPGQLLRPPLPG
ncbi:hypothetical protein SAMN04487912_102284 [Arthrobacter sp. cf158]|uniref:LysM peptidoglycan-binding domain-containing protein n=1 Tax=Arthrobacter sp. cf158 TaxID=1761744 RepID=UPI00089AFD80|nr:hypothetical protein [Arthrobacter sp. cf158]SDW31387.1 hypothetical protein SAMN04487912_102284 [Arthrobacter sp. cf158]